MAALGRLHPSGTGVYWKPVYAILEGALEIVTANAQHVKKVPKRKTDVKVAEMAGGLAVSWAAAPQLRSSQTDPRTRAT